MTVGWGGAAWPTPLSVRRCWQAYDFTVTATADKLYTQSCTQLTADGGHSKSSTYLPRQFPGIQLAQPPCCRFHSSSSPSVPLATSPRISTAGARAQKVRVLERLVSTGALGTLLDVPIHPVPACILTHRICPAGRLSLTRPSLTISIPPAAFGCPHPSRPRAQLPRILGTRQEAVGVLSSSRCCYSLSPPSSHGWLPSCSQSSCLRPAPMSE